MNIIKYSFKHLNKFSKFAVVLIALTIPFNIAYIAYLPEVEHNVYFFTFCNIILLIINFFLGFLLGKLKEQLEKTLEANNE